MRYDRQQPPMPKGQKDRRKTMPQFNCKMHALNKNMGMKHLLKMCQLGYSEMFNIMGFASIL